MHLTKELCDKWAKNKKVNPSTGRALDPTAANGLYKKLEEAHKLHKKNSKKGGAPYENFEDAVKAYDKKDEEFASRFALEDAEERKAEERKAEERKEEERKKVLKEKYIFNESIINKFY